MKRQRGRGRRSGGGNSNNPNRHFESNGPDVKIRGSAQQILDKYQQYARDAQSSGDRVSAENYLQHAEHYSRVLAAMQPKDKPRDEQRQQDQTTDAAESGEASSDTQSAPSQEGSSDADNTKPQRSRGRRRKRDEQASDDGNSEAAADGAPDSNAEAATEDAPKPRTRRPRKKADEAEAANAGEPDDGVMKTLSRGRTTEAAEATADEVVADADPVSETAAE
ncbi:MAG: DUF4167 domain-containing protein [Pseudomonadota bacterium]